MKIKIASIILPIIMAFFSNQTVVVSQETIKTITAFKHKANYAFSADWQYLSTDLYMLNSNKFSQLLNDIAKANATLKIKKLSGESIQSLFIKAKLKNLKFFGGDVDYPIYSFKVAEDKGVSTVETGNVEVIRLIDNLPLNESNEVIDAEIIGEAITQKNSNDILRLIGSQLQNIAKATTSNMAILGLVGELGKFIESRTGGTHYKFISTIRLYEGQDFNKKIHSVNIYVLAPSSLGTVNVLSENLKTYIDSSANPQIDQSVLNKLIGFKKYPVIVSVNYKSRYNSHPVVGDQINYEYLDARKHQIQNAFQNELINKYTYNQELKLIEFLEIFSDLKLNINNYKLNQKNNITNDYSKNLFVILKIYRDLLNAKKIRIAEFKNNPEFNNEFLPKYESVLNTANLYMNENSDLSVVKESGDLTNENQDPSKYAKQPEVCEHNLRQLYSVTIPADEEKSPIALDLIKLAQSIENAHFNTNFSPIVKKINTLPTDDAGFKEKEKIESQYGNTYCKSCKVEFSKAISSYNIKYQNAQLNILLKKNEEMNQQAILLLLNAIEKRKCIDSNMVTNQNLNSYSDLLKIELNKIDTLIKETRETLKIEINNFGAQKLEEHNFLLEAYIRRLELGLINFCKNINGICDCKKE